MVVLATAVKLLLIPCYKSTDFEVHRNWLAITSSLSIKRWYKYVEETSQWTLDYPPLFAWFEYCLAKLAVFFDPEMLKLQNLEYSSSETILFQRLSVIVTDLTLISSAWYAAVKSKNSQKQQILFFSLIVFNSGLIMIDHIHFQYNGFLIGILIWSALCIEEDLCLLAALCFAILLNLKHLFVYSAPVYFTYLLRHYCFRKSQNPFFGLLRIGLCVVLVFLCSFGPFAWYGQLIQVLRRMFPFGRGLCHAYWAPNAWALYAFLDKALSIFSMSSSTSTTTSKKQVVLCQLSMIVAGGLVGTWRFSVLPEISPSLSLLLVFLFACLPALLQLKNPSPKLFMECIAYANLCGFVWGYHVHEKATLPVLIPLIFVAFRKTDSVIMDHKPHFLCISTLAHYALTPLLFQLQEYPIKLLMVVSYALLVYFTIQEMKDEKLERTNFLQEFDRLIRRCLLVSILVLEMTQLGASVIKIKSRYEFLPLILTSVLCSFGITYHWLKWTYAYLTVFLVQTQN